MVGRSRRSPNPRITCTLVALVVLGAAASAHAQGSGTAAPGASPAPTSWRPRPVRTGTVSLGGQVGYGSLLGGTFADDFNNGLGLGFNLRYRTSPDAAFGVSFEAHNFGVKVKADSAAAHKNLQIIVTTVDYTKFGAIRSRMPRYVQIGAGFAQTRIKDNDGEKLFPGDGGVFKVGAGIEYWAWRTLSLDLGLRYHGVLFHSKLNHDVQVGLGFNFYTSP